MGKRDLLSASDLGHDELENLLALTEQMRGKPTAKVLDGRTIGLLFFNRSLRTRVSFEVATVQLGGHCINIFADKEIYDLEPEDQVVMDGKAEEHVKDAAQTLSRYMDAIGVRQLRRTDSWEVDRRELVLHSYSEHAQVPIINLESTLEHPCQAVADIVTMKQNLLSLEGRKFTLAWSNHPNPKSMGPCHSVLTLAATLGMDITIAHPLGFDLDDMVMSTVRERSTESGGKLRIVNDLAEGARGAEVLYARSWGAVKYWNDPEREAMVKRSMQSWLIDSSIMELTANALFMHPLPLRRNVTATDAVVDGARSVIYDQAENRVHAQKAILTHLLG